MMQLCQQQKMHSEKMDVFWIKLVRKIDRGAGKRGYPLHLSKRYCGCGYKE